MLVDSYPTALQSFDSITYLLVMHCNYKLTFMLPLN